MMAWTRALMSTPLLPSRVASSRSHAFFGLPFPLWSLERGCSRRPQTLCQCWVKVSHSNRKWPGYSESLGTLATAPGTLQRSDARYWTGDKAGWAVYNLHKTPRGSGRGAWECDFLLNSGRWAGTAGGSLAGSPGGPRTRPPRFHQGSPGAG